MAQPPPAASPDENPGAPIDAPGRLLADLPVAIASADADGRLTAMTPAWERITGWRVDEALGLRFVDFVVREERDRCDASEESMRRGVSDRSEGVARLDHRDGGTRYVEYRWFALRAPDGRMRGFVGTLLDVTQDAYDKVDGRTPPAGATALRRREDRSRALFERAAFGIFRCTSGGLLVDVNPALAAMLGYADATELMGRSLVADLCADESERVRLERELATDRVSEWYDLRWRRADRSVIQVRLAVSVERDAHGGLEFVQGIAENVTERMRREEIVRRGDRMASLGRTLAGVAHEINNPLAAITGFAQILLKREQSADDRHVHETILHEARRAARIVKDLLAVARREESHERTRVDLNEIVTYIVDTQRYAMETHGVQASLDLATGKVEAIADPAQLEQVVLNLVVNARQALEKAAGERANRGAEWTPSVRVTTRVGDGRVELEVEDNGPGIPALDLPQIFDPFWTTREEGEGPGLGLSVVHGIVTSHRGTIDVDSAVGGGTRFTVRLPRAPADVAPPPAADAGRADTPATLRARPLDILVVDDELVIRELLQRFLASRGHAVVAAADGAQALRLAERSSFDVVISDLRMPGMDGREVIRRLRELPTFASTTFILSTGDAESDAALEGAPGDVPIVPKPFDMDALIGVVEAGRPA